MFKANNGMMQMIIVMTFMIVNLPLLMLLMRQCNLSEFNYLDDKTTYKISSSIEEGPGGEPVNLACIQMDMGAAVSLACVNDVYCPVDGRVVRYSVNIEDINVSTTVNSSHILDRFISNENKTLRVVKNWETTKGTEFTGVINSVATNDLKNIYSNKDLYLVWNAYHDCWVVTPRFINVYGYTSDNINIQGYFQNNPNKGWRSNLQ